MATSENRLEQVLQSIEKLGPEELEVVERHLAGAKANHQVSSPPKTLLEDESFLIPFEDYLALSDDERDEIQFRAYANYRSWIYRELENRHARWLLVCGGKIIKSSPKLKDYPSDDKFYALGRQLGFAPLVFIANPVIEESCWTSLPNDDFYPSISITIGAADWASKELSEKGIAIEADLDTGAANLLFDYDRLRAENLIERQVSTSAHTAYHLGLSYGCYVLPVQIAVIDGPGTMKSTTIPALCVRNWQQSPLCIVNPFRKALVGRNLLLELPLRVELDGRNRTTRILAES